MTKTVLVTGASKGIGQGVALHLGKAGFHVVVHYHSDQEGANHTLEQIKAQGGSGRTLAFDISQHEATTASIVADIETHGAYYGVVNNAGIISDGAFPALTENDWNRVIHTNLDSFYNVIHPCIMPMIRNRKGGRIITMSSVSGIAGNRGQVNYSAAKAGIIGATKALAIELASRKITVNCVAPGLIDTGIMTDDFAKAEALKMIPMKRAGAVAEVASLVAYLMSDEASYITRQVISVNGGMV